MKSKTSLLLLLLSSAASGIAHAQDVAQAPVPEEEADAPGGSAGDESIDEEAIVITGSRPRGSVNSDIKPEITLDARDVRSFGANNIADLLEQLSPQTASAGGGPPVFLVNGRRVSGPREFQNFPSEAIERVEVFPEALALQYGYRADQRVVNLVLRERFRSINVEVEGGVATQGGRETLETEIGLSRIRGDTRSQFSLEYERSAGLLESERGVVRSVSNSPYDIVGNIRSAARPTAGAPEPEIDPALSALAGQIVTVAAVPGSADQGAPTLGSFVSGANTINVTDIGQYRSLAGSSEELSGGASINRPLSEDINASVSAEYRYTDSNSLQGLPSRTFTIPGSNPFSPFAGDIVLYRYFDNLGALERDAEAHNGQVAVALNGDLSRWRWSFDANYRRNSRTTLTDRNLDIGTLQERINAGDPSLNPFGALDGVIFAPRQRAFEVSDVANAQAVMNGPLFAVPAGDVRTSVRGGLSRQGTRSESQLASGNINREVAQSRASMQGSLDVPIASRRDDVLPFLGQLSANLNAELEQLSSYGALKTWGGGLNWNPFQPLSIVASYTKEERAPSIEQLGEAVIVTPNVRTFDFTRGETVDVTVTSGGNPDLNAPESSRFRLGATIRPIEEQDVTINVAYAANRTNNLIGGFPVVTAQIEAAFPERFVRDPSGRLISIDNRPVNFARSDQKQLNWTLSFSKPLGRQRPQGGWPRRPQEGAAGSTPAGTTPPAANPQSAAGAPGQRAEGGNGARSGAPRGPGGGGGRFGGGRGGFGGGPGGGQLRLSLTHTWRLQDELLIRDGLPTLDLLNGDATGRGGGRPAHEIQLQANAYKNGLGARVNTRWQSSTFVRGTNDSRGQTSDLFFSDQAIVNLRLFVDLGNRPALMRRTPWLRNTRLALDVDNLFDSLQEVRNDLGERPPESQPDGSDLIGRTVSLSLRKSF